MLHGFQQSDFSIFLFWRALFCYYIVPQKFIRVRNAVLLFIQPVLFYFYGEPRLIGILNFSILMNYLFGLSMRSTYRKPLLILCVIANLSLLGVFKYLNFFISTADSLLGLSIPVPGIVMPIGISFYTFQALSYVIDVYRREVPPQHDPFSLALYVSMFPQLIAGPIVRYHDVNVQLAVRKHSFAQFSEGISRFLFGLSKKVLLSNVFAQIADGVFKYAPSELSAAGAWMGAIGYTLQIYFDFSGYSDMAIGLGKMFGFEFLENFNYPLHQQVSHRVLAPLAYLAVHLVPRLCVHSAGRQRCSPAAYFQSACRMDDDRLLARCQLDVYGIGSVLFGVLLILEKEIPRRMDYAPAVRAAACLCAVFLSSSAGCSSAAIRWDWQCSISAACSPRRCPSQPVRNRISAAVLAIPAVRCCIVRTVFPRLRHPYLACTGFPVLAGLFTAVPDAPARQRLAIYLFPLLRRAET